MASPWAQAKAGQKISAPKTSKYQGYQGQPGGIASIPSSGKKAAFVQLQKQKFFGDRPDISEDRVLRRTRQEGALNQFKQSLIDKGRVAGNITTASGDPVFLTDVPGGRSVADYSMDLARRFGPTPRELMSDIGYGAGQLFKGLGDFALSGGVMGKMISGAKGLLDKGIGAFKDAGKYLQGESKFIPPQAPGSIPTQEEQNQGAFNLESKMSAYEDPLKFYADVSKRDIQTLKPIKDMGLGYDSSINMFSPVIKDLKKKNPSLTDEEIKGIIEGTITEPTGQFAEATKTTIDPYALIRGTQETLSNLGKTRYGTFGIDNPLDIIRGGAPSFTYEKELGPGVLSGKIGDNKASLGYSMIFNKGGRVRGTGIMGAL